MHPDYHMPVFIIHKECVIGVYIEHVVYYSDAAIRRIHRELESAKWCWFHLAYMILHGEVLKEVLDSRLHYQIRLSHDLPNKPPKSDDPPPPPPRPPCRLASVLIHSFKNS